MNERMITVYGSASCGKTLYLKKKAEYLRKQGKKVLVIGKAEDGDARMSKYQCNVNNFSIEKDERFFAYINIVGAKRIVKLLNKQEEKIKELETRNERQYNRLKEITDLMTERDWESLEKMIKDWEQAEEQLKREWRNYENI